GGLPFPANWNERGRTSPGTFRSDRNPSALFGPRHVARRHPWAGTVPPRHEVRVMNDQWFKALILAAVFGAVLLAVDTFVGWLSRNRTEGKAINLRLKLINQGRSAG